MKLSIIIPFRASEDRAYIVERLEQLVVEKNTSVEYILVDSGSPLSLQDKVKTICTQKGIKYLYQDTLNSIFAIGDARDYGVEYSNGEFVTFLDIDLVCVNDFINKLLEQCEIEIKNQKKSFFTIPCFYLTQEGSEVFLKMDSDKRDDFFYNLYIDGDQTYIQNLAPSSSVMVVRREHYLSVGGHSPAFKGHGYEDFELVHRLLKLSNHIPRSRDYYFDSKTWDSNLYRGFRATFSMLGQKSLLNKLFVFHIWHPRPPSNGYENARFENHVNALDKFKQFDKDGLHPTPLIDKTKRVENALFFGRPFENATECLRDAMPYIGNIIYTLEYYYQNDDESFNEEKFKEFLNYNDISKIIFTNPYGNKTRLAIYNYVRKNDLDYYCFDRGALPDSWFFDANGFNYDSSSYSEEKWSKKLSSYEEEITKAYINQIFSQGSSLEKQSTRLGKSVLSEQLKIGNNKVLFVPLQRPSDTVIKYFTKPLESDLLPKFMQLSWTSEQELLTLKDFQFQKEWFYKKPVMINFLEIVDAVAKELRTFGWKVLVKQHPSEFYRVEMKYATVVPDHTNMYDLIELSNSMALINSGMGLYAMMAKKPCFIFGNAFYSHEGLNFTVNSQNSSIEEIVKMIIHTKEIDNTKVLQFIYYLIQEFYSFGEAHTYERIEKDGSKRTITKSIDFYKLVIANEVIYDFCKDGKFTLPFGSPLFNRFKLDMANQRQQKSVVLHKQQKSDAEQKTIEPQKSVFSRKLNKFRKNKKQFFQDSNNIILKLIGKVFY
ncbi:MAG: glycosyltransferase [Sulfurovum sp.]|nr:glycosyltransferase [Sulfurovum sp.]MDD3499770.1 glycosyltransferase [Sulfurovum sp.]